MPRVHERVYRVEAPYAGNAVHLYLVRGSKLALIDSGASDSPERAVAPALRELGLAWTDLDFLLNTHGHPDHAGGNGEVKQAAPRAEIRMHQADVHLAGGPDAHLHSRHDASSLLRQLGREDLVPEREAMLRQVIGRSVGVDRELVDGDRVDLGQGVVLDVVHTPGHTNGSVCYVWEAEQLVFSGDAVQGHGWRAGVAPLYFDAVYVESLERIAGLGAETLCMGHTFGWSGVSNDPVRRGEQVAETLASSQRASQLIDRACAQALETLGQDAPFKALAEAAFRELVYELPITWDRRTLLSAATAAPLRAHLEAHGWQAPA